jgi:hypothetical protein
MIAHSRKIGNKLLFLSLENFLTPSIFHASSEIDYRVNRTVDIPVNAL